MLENRNKTILNAPLEIGVVPPSMSAIFEQRASEILDGYLPFLQKNKVATRSFVRLERRAKARVNDSLPTRLWGLDAQGEVLSLDCFTDILSSSGVFLRLPCQLQVGSQINLVVRLMNGSGDAAAITGRVLRDDAQLDGSRGVAIVITRHRFL